MNASKIFIFEEEFTMEEGSLFKQSTLQICDARLRDSGNYTCIVSNGVNSVNESVELALAGEYYL